MKILKITSEVERAVNEIERILDKHGMSIQSHSSLFITDRDGNEFDILDIETSETIMKLPRFVDSERLVLKD